jgi:hypothetical protein
MVKATGVDAAGEKPPARKGDARQEARLAEALRANLRRRKAAPKLSAPAVGTGEGEGA